MVILAGDAQVVPGARIAGARLDPGEAGGVLGVVGPVGEARVTEQVVGVDVRMLPGVIGEGRGAAGLGRGLFDDRAAHVQFTKVVVTVIGRRMVALGVPGFG